MARRKKPHASSPSTNTASPPSPQIRPQVSPLMASPVLSNATEPFPSYSDPFVSPRSTAADTTEESSVSAHEVSQTSPPPWGTGIVKPPGYRTPIIVSGVPGRPSPIPKNQYLPTDPPFPSADLNNPGQLPAYSNTLAPSVGNARLRPEAQSFYPHSTSPLDAHIEHKSPAAQLDSPKRSSASSPIEPLLERLRSAFRDRTPSEAAAIIQIETRQAELSRRQGKRHIPHHRRIDEDEIHQEVLKVREERENSERRGATPLIEQQLVPAAKTFSCHPVNEPIFRRHSTTEVERERKVEAQINKKEQARTLTGTQLLDPPELRLQCLVCQDSVESVAFTCSNCRSGYCHMCLKKQFLAACGDESLMPPKCCSQLIGLVHVCEVLTSSEIALYKRKYEEWSSPYRLYCPRPGCSTFVRLGKLVYPPPVGLDILRRRNPVLTVVQQCEQFENMLHAFYRSMTGRMLKRKKHCPKCGTRICNYCRAPYHRDGCNGTIAPNLDRERQHCPRCQRSINKTKDISRIQCVCGAVFCYFCRRQPYFECANKCNMETGRRQSDGLQVVEDGKIDVREDNGDDLGPPRAAGTISDLLPDGKQVRFGSPVLPCSHVWLPSLAFSFHEDGERGVIRCADCSRSIKFRSGKNDLTGVYMDLNNPRTGEQLTAPWSGYSPGALGWQCYGGHLKCKICPIVAPVQRTSDSTWMWQCDCGKVCGQCDHIKAKELRARADEMAWQCSCHKMICGACAEQRHYPLVGQWKSPREQIKASNQAEQAAAIDEISIIFRISKGEAENLLQQYQWDKSKAVFTQVVRINEPTQENNPSTMNPLHM